jgi:hypothetical protein
MVAFAASIDGQLQSELHRLALEPLTFAEISREIGVRAESLGQVRPSYARVRQLVIEARASVAADYASEDPSWARLLLDVDLRHRSPMAIIDKLDGVPVRQDGALSWERRRRGSS